MDALVHDAADADPRRPAIAQYAATGAPTAEPPTEAASSHVDACRQAYERLVVAVVAGHGTVDELLVEHVAETLSVREALAVLDRRAA